MPGYIIQYWDDVEKKYKEVMSDQPLPVTTVGGGSGGAEEVEVTSWTATQTVKVEQTGALPAGTNTIGDVGVTGALPAGTNNIGKVDVNSLPFSKPASSLGSQQQNLTTANFPLSFIAGSSLMIQSDPTNTVNIVFGETSANKFMTLIPGQSMYYPYPVVNLAAVSGTAKVNIWQLTP